MTHARLASLAIALATIALHAPVADAGPPSAPHSDCAITVTQAQCLGPSCLAANPIVLRLCPAGEFDRATFDLVVRDASGTPCPDVPVKAVELSATARVSSGGASTDATDEEGRASIDLQRASGHGRVGICAGGVILREVVVRTFDVAVGPLPPQCAFPASGNSIVNVSDVTNPACGFLSKFGLVTPGVNDAWDLNCDGSVNASDVNGTFCPPCGLCGSWYAHAFHGRGLSLSGCP
jgi:hypothetical protein